MQYLDTIFSVRFLLIQRIPLWVATYRDRKATRNRGSGCGSSSRTKCFIRTLLVRYNTRAGASLSFCQDVFEYKWRSVIVCVCAQDVAALESQPLLGFFLREEKSGPAEKLQFKLYHKNILYYIFRADDIPTAQRYTHTCTQCQYFWPP